MKRKVPSQETGPLLNVSPEERQKVFGCAGQVLFVQIALFAIGLHNALAVPTSSRGSIGQFVAMGVGASIVLVLVWTAIYAVASSPMSRVFQEALPLRGRWAAYVVMAILFLVGLLAVVAVVIAPGRLTHLWPE